MGASDDSSTICDGFYVSKMDSSDIHHLAMEFVVQYYTVLKKCPSSLHRFYKDDSSMIRDDNVVRGQKAIHDNIMKLNICDSKVGILKLDALHGLENSVLVQVSGEISINGGQFRRFMQSFLLCEQSPCDFYVLNDIFRYQDSVYGDTCEPSVSGNVRTIDMQPENILELSLSNDCEVNPNVVQSKLPLDADVWKNSISTEVQYNSSAPVNINVHNCHAELHSVEKDKVLDQQILPVCSASSPQPIVPISFENNVNPAAPSEPFTWAQMASKQPSNNSGQSLKISCSSEDKSKVFGHNISSSVANQRSRNNNTDGRLTADDGLIQYIRNVGQISRGRGSVSMNGRGRNMRAGNSMASGRGLATRRS